VRGACLLPAVLVAAMAFAGHFCTAAQGQTTAKLSATFVPNKLGRRTTLEFGFSFSAPAGQVPPPLTSIQLRYPNNLGIALSGLGLATCNAATLEKSGPAGCPSNAVMGYGIVLTGVVIGTTVITENATITILRAPNAEGHLALLFYAEGTTPVVTSTVFAGLLLPASSPFGGLVSIGVPLVTTLPGGPYVSVINLRATLGPRKVLYYEKISGQTLAYRPTGILLPPTCPRRGFPFSAEFTFTDSSHANASTAARCAAHKGRRH
jgi:hypothetical protein